jgi:uncharacterized membrane protein YbhN (UPF0104 family)
MAAKYRKYVEFIALFLLAVGIVWWFGRKLDWIQVKGSLAASDWRLILLGGVLVLGGYGCRAIRWRAFLKPLTEASLREVWIATTVGYAAVLTLGRVAEIVRPLVLPMRDPRVRPAASFVTILIERVYDSIAVLLLFAFNLAVLMPAANAADFNRARQVGFGLIGALSIVLAGLVIFRWKSERFIGWLENKIPEAGVGGRLKATVITLLRQLATALGVLTSAKELFVTVSWTLALWLLVAAGNLLAMRAFGLPFGPSEALFVLGWAMIGSAIPTPGGAAGAFHAVTGGALILLGVAREQAAALAIVIHLVDFLPGALFGLFYFLRGDVTISRLRLLISAHDREPGIQTVATAGDAKAA